MLTNKKNYNQEMKRIMDQLQESYAKEPSKDKVRLLLHACCAPCASSCLERLRDTFDITVYFYNPNIATSEEYYKRASELGRFINTFCQEVKLIVADYNPDEFLKVAKGYEDCPERGQRCMRCYDLRLRETARFVLEHTGKINHSNQAVNNTTDNMNHNEEGYDYFATTLTLSPLKDAEALNKIGYAIQQELGISYLPSDFKKDDGYKRSIELSREYGLYRQNYCGCAFSKINIPDDTNTAK